MLRKWVTITQIGKNWAHRPPGLAGRLASGRIVQAGIRIGPAGPAPRRVGDHGKLASRTPSMTRTGSTCWSVLDGPCTTSPSFNL